MYYIFLKLIFCSALLQTIFNSTIVCDAEKKYLRFRNSLLRIYIASDKKRVLNEYGYKILDKTKNKCNNVYQTALSKYYDIQIFYNSLTDEEREFLDTIISSLYY